MTYDFAMDKKTVISVLAGCAVMAVLLFAAGWIAGMNWTTGATASAATSGKTARATEPPALPKEPVLREDADQGDVDAPAKTTGVAPPAGTSPGGAVAAPQQPSAAVGDGGGHETAGAPAGNDDSDDQEKLVQAADPEPPAAAAATQGDGTNVNSAFTVQVGVFLDPKEASRFLSTMEKHGYAPSFFADRDAEDRQWYAVRIGAYSDKGQAARAAANFTKQESIKAVVRPLGSL
jgi:septal ring-binding cell division protein DamX